MYIYSVMVQWELYITATKGDGSLSYWDIFKVSVIDLCVYIFCSIFRTMVIL